MENQLAARLPSFSDDDLSSCYDDVTCAAIASRVLSAAKLDVMTDALAVMAIDASAARAEMESQVCTVLTLLQEAVVVNDSTREPPPVPLTNREVGLPDSGLTRTGKFDFRSGDKVQLTALDTRPALNGASGVIVEPGFEPASGRYCMVTIDDETGAPLYLSVLPGNLRLTNHACDTNEAIFISADGEVTSRSVQWCRVNGFDEVVSGLWAGPWWTAFPVPLRTGLVSAASAANRDPSDPSLQSDVDADSDDAYTDLADCPEVVDSSSR